MTTTPETDEAWDAVSRQPDGFYDSQVTIHQYAYAMLDHARKMERQRDELRHQIRETLMENLNLADGDKCTLKRLKDAIGFDLQDENQTPPMP